MNKTDNTIIERALDEAKSNVTHIEAISSVLDEIDRNMKWCMVPCTTEDGEIVKNEDGDTVYKHSDYDYDRFRAIIWKNLHDYLMDDLERMMH